MKILTVLFMSTLLIGCASVDIPRVPDYQIPANLIVKCEELPEMRGDTLGDLYKYTIEIITLYNVCATRHDSLAKAVTKPQ